LLSTSSSSRLPGFYKLDLQDRCTVLQVAAGFSPEELAALTAGLDPRTADGMIENAIGVYGLPLGIGLNFLVNGREVLVPMAVEEPSVVAAASNAARMVRAGGGFVAEADESIMTAQVELRGVRDHAAAVGSLRAALPALLEEANAMLPRLVARGGGVRELEVRDGGGAERLVVHIHVDCRDAMGANIVNTLAEAMAGRLALLAGGYHGLRILTNLCDRRCVRVKVRVPVSMLATGQFAGDDVAEGIEAASRFAEDDPYRAATHNKGIMNGVDPVVIATGNDWRGVEAGAHAFAARQGRYSPLATWRVRGEELCGDLAMPMAVGTVGGTLGRHPVARAALRLTRARSAGELGMVIASAGLASNLAALRALSSEGIQRGHMALHTRSLSLTSVVTAENGAHAPAIVEAKA
jgi:hydroxymethylglutaryl-CoA reductase